MAEKVYRAGLIPVHIDENGDITMMFMKPTNKKYCGGDYQIAKGRIEPNEEVLDAAIREAVEELGLRTSNIEKMFDCGVWLGRTFMFAALVKNQEDFDDFQDETESVCWMTDDEFQQTGRDIHREVVHHIASMVEMDYVQSLMDGLGGDTQ